MKRVLLAFLYGGIVTSAANGPAGDLPAGAWEVEFANGVVETADIRGDGTARVTEPERSAGGRAVNEGGSIVITFDDDRVERWTAVGQRTVVEHWYPAAAFPHGAPVLGIAERSVARLEELEGRTKELEARNATLVAESARLNLQLLKSYERLLQSDPDAGTKRKAAALAAQLAPRLPGNPIVWRVLIATETLKDGLSVADAERLLGPPTTREDEYVEWYFNPSSRRHVAPALRASVTEAGLADWELFRR